MVWQDTACVYSLQGYSSCTVPYNTSSLRHVMLLSLHCVILHCNIGWCIKDGAVHRGRQQWLIACHSQMVRLGVIQLGLGLEESASLLDLSLIYGNGSGSWRLARIAYLINSGPNGSTH